MNAKKGSYLLVILSIVAVFMLAFAAGCTGNGTKQYYAGPDCIPHSCCNNAGTGINNSSAGNNHCPSLNRPETDHQDQWFNNRIADCPEGG